MKNVLLTITFLCSCMLASTQAALAQSAEEPSAGDACEKTIGENDSSFQIPQWAEDAEFRTQLKCMVSYIKNSVDYTKTYSQTDEQKVDFTIKFIKDAPYIQIVQWNSTPVGDASLGPQYLMPYEFDKLLNNGITKQYNQEVKTTDRFCRSGITWRPANNFSYDYAKLQMTNDKTAQKIDLKVYAAHPSMDMLFGIVNCKGSIVSK